MHQRHQVALVLVDHPNGATRRLWADAGIPFEFIEYNAGNRHVLPAADLVLMGLLGSKNLASNFEISPASRFLTWCTAPQDPFKFLPPAYFLNNSSWSVKKGFARCFYPAHRLRIADFLKEGARRGGVVFMDMHCHEVNEDLFGSGIPQAVIPICTGVPTIGPRLRKAGTGKAYWVGRITDFKTEPFIAMAKALLRPGSPIKEVVVIGDGADLSSAKERLSGLAVTWLGYVEPEKLDAELFAHADLVYGHGTALLEAAKLGIPSLLVDGSYGQVACDLLRAEWLHQCPVGYVGRITRANQLIGRKVEECLAEFSRAAEQLADADYSRWQEAHHPDAVTDKLAEVIARGDYTAMDFFDSGAARPGWFGAMIEWTKRNVFHRIY
jgi:glycosyltransferase involved in cell wall biosynthesis